MEGAYARELWLSWGPSEHSTYQNDEKSVIPGVRQSWVQLLSLVFPVC